MGEYMCEHYTKDTIHEYFYGEEIYEENLIITLIIGGQTDIM